MHYRIGIFGENLSNPDTNGAEESVFVSEVSSFQRLKCMQEWYLGWEKVSCLERCPQCYRCAIDSAVIRVSIYWYIASCIYICTHTMQCTCINGNSHA